MKAGSGWMVRVRPPHGSASHAEPARVGRGDVLAAPGVHGARGGRGDHARARAARGRGDPAPVHQVQLCPQPDDCRRRARRRDQAARGPSGGHVQGRPCKVREVAARPRQGAPHGQVRPLGRLALPRGAPPQAPLSSARREAQPSQDTLEVGAAQQLQRRRAAAGPGEAGGVWPPPRPAAQGRRARRVEEVVHRRGVGPVDRGGRQVAGRAGGDRDLPRHHARRPAGPRS
mmetsp:Transcript_22762/g.64863  ORF Transcript_22762/g.64863 Transcript_22762/m.64863 type:complete len:230 (-) Transcript_22762:1031-1720(-)